MSEREDPGEARVFQITVASSVGAAARADGLVCLHEHDSQASSGTRPSSPASPWPLTPLSVRLLRDQPSLRRSPKLLGSMSPARRIASSTTASTAVGTPHAGERSKKRRQG